MIYTRALIAVAALICTLGLLLIVAVFGFSLFGQSALLTSWGWPPMSGISTAFSMIGWGLLAGCLGEIGNRVFDLHNYFVNEVDDKLDVDTVGDDI